MNLRVLYALIVARNREFLRDRGTMAWNFLFPFLAVAAMAVVFSGDDRELYKVAVHTPGALPGIVAAANGATPADGAAPDASAHGRLRDQLVALAGDNAEMQAFFKTRYVQFVPVDNLELAQDKVRHHLFDMLVDLHGPPRYWINPTNPKGYFLERVLWGTTNRGGVERGELPGRGIRYIDWLLPGVLGMNIMFSCLFGVGYVIVRYRKGLILRRLKVTPINAVQFLSAQIASRLLLVMFTTAVLFFGLDLLLGFYRAGPLLDLFVVFALGSVCLIALGILVASRTSNLELAGGLLNLATWPMMFLSGVWFSLEGSAPWLIWLSKALPLTHLIDAARAIMVDGATLAGVVPELTWLSVMTLVFLALGAGLFRWE